MKKRNTTKKDMIEAMNNLTEIIDEQEVLNSLSDDGKGVKEEVDESQPAETEIKPVEEPTPILTIIIPSHNMSDSLISLCDALSRQTTDEFKVIIVDDGSDVPVSEYMIPVNLKSRTKIIRNNKPSGPGGGRNTGLHAADTDYIWYIDADDMLASLNAVAHVIDKLKSSNNTDCLLLGFDTYKNHKITQHSIFNFNNGWTDIAYAPIAPWCKVFKRSVCIDMPENVWIEDCVWWFMQADKLTSADHLDEIVYIYNRDSEKAITNTVEYCGSHPHTLEQYAFENILEEKNLVYKLVPDQLRNLAALADLKGQLRQQHVINAWVGRLRADYANIMTGRFCH